MSIPFKHGDLKFNVTQSWDEVTTEQFFALSKCKPKDTIGKLMILTGCSRNQLLAIGDHNINFILAPHLSWTNELIDWDKIPVPETLAIVESIVPMSELSGFRMITKWIDAIRGRITIMRMRVHEKVMTVPTDLELESFGKKIVYDQLLKDAILIEEGKGKKIKGKKQDKVTADMARIIPYGVAVYFAQKFSGKEFDEDLVDELFPKIIDLPITIVYPIGNFFFKDIQRIWKLDKVRLDSDIDIDEQQAGLKELDVFGVFKTIDSLAGGDILKYDEVLQQEYSTIVVKLTYEKAVAKYRERLMEIKQRKAKNKH